MSHGLKTPVPKEGPFLGEVKFSEKLCSDPNWFPPVEGTKVSVEVMKRLIKNSVINVKYSRKCASFHV